MRSYLRAKIRKDERIDEEIYIEIVLKAIAWILLVSTALFLIGGFYYANL